MTFNSMVPGSNLAEVTLGERTERRGGPSSSALRRPPSRSELLGAVCSALLGAPSCSELLGAACSASLGAPSCSELLGAALLHTASFENIFQKFT